MNLSATGRLAKLYGIFAGDDRVLIMISADPDAIASAMAVKRLLWRRVSGVVITNINRVDRPDNIKMIELLGANLTHIEEINTGEYSKFILVDSQPSHSEYFSEIDFDVIIDHHPDTSPKATYLDIRPEYGATASIMTEYLRAGRIKPSSKLATALFYAIKTDTGDFERKALLEDVKAFQFLFKHANSHLVLRIDQAELEPEFLKYFERAIRSRKTRRGRLYAHLGIVPSADVCVLIADFFMRVNNVRWSIVSGIAEEKLIVIFRNDGLRKDAGKVAKRSFGKIGQAGGHKAMARAELDLNTLSGDKEWKDSHKLAKWIIRQVEESAGKK